MHDIIFAMPSVTASGYIKQSFDLAHPNIIMATSFALDIVSILTNIIVFVLLQLPRYKNPYSNLLKICSLVQVSYKILFIIYVYTDAHPVVNLLYVIDGYSSLISSILVQLELFKRFVTLAASLLGGKFKDSHIYTLQIVLMVLFVLCCIVPALILAGHLGDFEFAMSDWFHFWYIYMAMLFVAIVALTYLFTASYQIYLMRRFIAVIGEQQGVKTDMKKGFRKLYLHVISCSVVILLGYCFFALGQFFGDFQDSTLLVDIGTSFSSLLSLNYLLLSNDVKVLLVSVVSGSHHKPKVFSGPIKEGTPSMSMFQTNSVSASRISSLADSRID
ncbi:hypothetical protein EDD86DRAFT_7804 [Gorgonomyces haynaldii]|nr:hypothetical protein EDD86DRAFT_7804 [Gorgonomyces haynaldii]